jgi:hypothetical protein
LRWLPIPPGRKIGGSTAALTCIYIVTALLSELLTNNAAAAIMWVCIPAAGAPARGGWRGVFGDLQHPVPTLCQAPALQTILQHPEQPAGT